MADNSANFEFVQQRVRFSARYNFIIFPVNYTLLQKILTSRGYTVATPPPELQSASGMFSVDGSIGIKDGVSVDTQMDKQILGISSNNVDKLIHAFDELEQDISLDLSEEISSRALFYEAILQFIIKTGKNPLNVMKNLKKKILLCDSISSILGQDVAPFGVRFSPAGIPVDSENWFDFRVEPMISKSTTVYYVSLVLRNKLRTKVVEIITNSTRIISSTLQEIESGI